jgi:hypothetical protein
MPIDEPFCPVGPHTDGIEILGWIPEHQESVTIKTNGRPARHPIDIQASVIVDCPRHGQSQVGVSADWRPAGWPGLSTRRARSVPAGPALLSPTPPPVPSGSGR